MIYDCFTFFNELDLLEIRLNTLDAVVDKFVIVEATFTHQGKPKPLYFQENKGRYKAFEEKIIHVVANEPPSFFTKFRKPTSWDLERFQRNEIIKGLRACKPDDVVIVSDLDEIPKPEEIVRNASDPGIKIFQLDNYYYFLNCYCTHESERTWIGPAMAYRKDFRSPQDLRAVSNKLRADNLRLINDAFYRFRKSLSNPVYRKQVTLIDRAGWHFSYLGGVAKIIEKLEAFAHTEYNKERFKDERTIVQAIANGEDIFGRGFKYQFLPIDNAFPEYVRSHAQKFSNLIRS